MENRSQNLDSQEQRAPQGAKISAKSRAQEAAAKVGIGKSQSLFTLILSSIAASALIASYVLSVGLFVIHKKHTDTISDAALETAKELSDITVEHTTTGSLTLCKWRDRGPLFFDSAKEKTRSFESMKRTYAKIKQLATLTGVVPFSTLVGKDEVVLNQIERELRVRLDQAILPSSNNTNRRASNDTTSNASELPGRIYKSVASLIASRYGLTDPASIQLSIKLGYNTNFVQTSTAQLSLVDAANFKPAPPGVAPNMVLVSYHEPTKHDKDAREKPKEPVACIFIKPAPESPAPGALVLTFPQGTPPFALRLMDYLKYKDWQAKGLWQQPMGGEVPGPGSLAPPLEPLLPEMTPGDALAVEIYHWLKYAGDRMDPATVKGLLEEQWSPAPQEADSSQAEEHSFGMMDDQINSCLVADNGSREHAFLYEGKEGAPGQSALAKAFVINESFRSSATLRPRLPESAFPFFIDQQGHCTVPGQEMFDEKLLRDFLYDLYATNLAARETLATVRAIQQNSLPILEQLEKRLGIEREEQESLVLRYNRLGIALDGKEKDKKLSMNRTMTKARIEDLKSIIESDSAQLRQTRKLQKLAAIARYNASFAEFSTFDLNALKLRYCRDGLFKVPGRGYLLGRNLAFKPIAKALQDSDFYELSDNNLDKQQASEEGQAPSGKQLTEQALEAQSPWLTKNFTLIGAPSHVFPDLDKTFAKHWQDMLNRNLQTMHFQPRMLVFDSREIVAGRRRGKKLARSFTCYPFNNIPLPQSELVYYCQTAVTTGDKPKVAWSVLARDFLANRGMVTGFSSSQNFVGLPIQSENSSWCKQEAFDTDLCPGLACEFQIRSPLPLVEKTFENAYLQTSETGRQEPLIPVVTPDML